MFSSLRSRLWLSYALVTVIALGVVSVFLFVYLIRNPFAYRQAAVKLTVAEADLLNRQSDWTDLPTNQLQKSLKQASDTFDVRILVFDGTRDLLADSRPGKKSLLTMPRFPRLQSATVQRDSEGKAWLYILRQLDNGRWLMIATPRPKVALLGLLSDEFFRLILEAGIAAFLFSLLLAFLISRWIADPLQSLVLASRKMPDLDAKPLSAQGPHEVKEVINAFNEMSARVRLSQQSQRDFVANVSHELKTPLTSIQGFAQAIVDGTVDTPETLNQAGQIIYDESGRMHRMVLDLLDLARLDAGTFDLKHGSVDMAALLNTVIARFAPAVRSAGVNFEVTMNELPAIYGDGDRLAQVFTNLIDNAIKFSASGGVVSIDATVSGDGILVNVSDSGVGVPTQDLAHIFDRFYQSDKARQGGDGHGTGLGLAIAKEIVTAHRGTIVAQSVPGQGSTFSVRLPLVPPDISTVAQRKKS